MRGASRETSKPPWESAQRQVLVAVEFLASARTFTVGSVGALLALMTVRIVMIELALETHRYVALMAALLAATGALAVVGGVGQSLVAHFLSGRGRRAAAMVGVTIVAAAAHAVTTAWLSVELVGQTVAVPLRVILIAVAVSLAAYLVETYRKFRRTKSNIEHRLRDHERILERNRLAVQVARGRLRDIMDRQVATSLREIVNSMDSSLPGDYRSQIRPWAHKLRRLAVADVRPLSHEIGGDRSPAPSVIDPNVVVNSPTQSTAWREVVNRVPYPDKLAPISVGMTVFLLTVSHWAGGFGGLIGGGGQVLVAAGVCGVAIGLAVVGARAVVSRYPQSLSPGARWFLFLLAVAIGMAIVSPIYRVAVGQFDRTWWLNVSITMGLSIATLLCCTGRAIVDRGRAALASEAAALAAVSWALADYEREELRIRRTIAQHLHGHVQGRLSMAGVLLSDVDDPRASDTQVAAAVEVVRDSLRRIIEDLDDLAYLEATTGPVDLAGALAELRAAWVAVCDVSLDASPATLDRIRANQASARLLVDVVSEAVTNAVRHGAARHVVVRLEEASPDTIQVQIDDDGTGVDSAWASGMGTRSFTDLGLSWQLTARPDGGSRLSVEIPDNRARSASG